MSEPESVSVSVPELARRVSTQPATLADLKLPPTFVADQCIRTLFYQGALSPIDLAKHWRVHPDIAVEAVDSLKSAGLIEVESGQSTFERLGRVKLNGAGNAYVAQARSRTWYAGPLPVSLEAFERESVGSLSPLTNRDNVRAALAPFHFEDEAAHELGQAIAGGATVALVGASFDEQPELAASLGKALSDEITVPFSIYASGAVIRVFDWRIHRPIRAERAGEDETDILRSHDGLETQWSRIERPVLALSGGVLESDMLPAYDADAKFYLAPTPFKACGGILAIFDATANEAALAELARLWLVPGRHGAGILLLRSGERIEVPWHACTLLFGAEAQALPESLRDTLAYTIDVSRLRGQALRAFLMRRLSDPAVYDDAAIDGIAGALERWDITRASAARAARYLADRVAYEGAAFELNDTVAEQAAAFACATPARTQLRRAA